MENQNENAAFKVAKGKLLKRVADTSETTEIKKELTNEELQAEVERLQKKLNSIPSDLEERKAYFTLKNEIIKKF